MRYLNELNEAQRQAVTTTEGPLLIIAGAGAGKTRAIAYRILYLIKQGVPPEQILAVTFTNKAAAQMRERIDLLLEKTARRRETPAALPLISTFHSLSAKLLREHAALLKLPRHFTIFDRSDSLRALREAMKSAGVPDASIQPAQLLSIISKEKGSGVTREVFVERGQLDRMSEGVTRVWERYEEILAKVKALDFDDLLLQAVALLRREPHVLAQCRARWRYIHIDEYQDTNAIQYELTHLLVGKTGNVCVVGDSDQNIYSWRGANLQHLLEFTRDYPHATVVRFEENYRSTKTILEVANRIIEKNKRRWPKRLFTRNPRGEKIDLYVGADEADEARFIAAEARAQIKKGTPPGEIAVLYRTNFQSRALEEAVLAERIPHQVVGVRFFERKEVKDVVAYLNAALLGQGSPDWKRVLNFPPRGIGKVSLLKILSGKEKDLPAATREKLSAFHVFLRRIREAVKVQPLSEVLRVVVTESGLEEHLSTGSVEDEERLRNIRELSTFAIRYDALPPKEAMETFLADVSLSTDQDELAERHNAVRLMTVHTAKGLEFDVVFVSGLEEGLFPHERSRAKERGDPEEERRLFYVAVTRAREKLYLTYASVRTIFGVREVKVPSEFLFEIDGEHLTARSGAEEKVSSQHGARKKNTRTTLPA